MILGITEMNETNRLTIINELIITFVLIILSPLKVFEIIPTMTKKASINMIGVSE